MNPPARPRVVSLFSGIGATDLALEHLGCETVAHSDIEPYANDVFALRFPGSTQLGNVTDITTVPACEVMAGGFPCQDISNAGLRAGIGGSRSGLWSEFFRLIGLARPKVVLIENVSALLSRGLDVVLADLASIGYTCEWDCIPAAAVGAPHLRDRIWITAYAEDEDPVREDRLERSLGTLAHPPSKWPRAGRMCQGAVYVREPLAPRKTRRLNPGSAWIGARLTTRHGWWHDALLPTPAASMAERGGRGDLLQVVRGNPSPTGHFTVPPHLLGPVPMFPTATARDWKDTGDLSKVPENSLLPRVVDRMERERLLLPTPRASWNENRTLKRAPSHGKTHGAVLAGEVNEYEAEAGRPRGHLHPDWVEWLMGFPLGWTDLTRAETRWHGWNHEPHDVPRVGEHVDKRKQRLHALGNGQVPQVMHWWAAPAVERLR